MTIEEHFEGKEPKLKNIYNKLVEKLAEFGDVQIIPVQAGVTFVAGDEQFAMVYVLSKGMTLEFQLGETLHHERIKRVDEASDDVYLHYVILDTPQNINKQLLEWLKIAYDRKA